jgi:transcriptional regulator with XRE-family HTH domain
MSDFLKLVGARIKQLRLKRELSQAKLAEAAELQYSYIGGVERGVRNISLNSLEKIMLALKVDPVEALKFGDLSEIDGVTEKYHIAEMHRALLMNRSLAEAKMIHRIVQDMLETFDKERDSK